MGMFDKVKKILFDEDVIEVPVESDELPERTPKAKKQEDRASKSGFIDYHSDNEYIEEDTIVELKVPQDNDKDIKKSYSGPVDDEFIEEYESTRNHNYDNIDLSFMEEEKVEEPVIVEPRRVVEQPKRVIEEVSDTRESREKSIFGDNNKKTNEIKDYRKMLGTDDEKEEKKPFQNTPVISPVWGILDKDYKPEEIVEKTELINKVNTGAYPRSYGPISYNDQPLPTRQVKKVEVEEEIAVRKVEPVVEKVEIADVEVTYDEEPTKEISIDNSDIPKYKEIEEVPEPIIETPEIEEIEEVVPTHSIDEGYSDNNSIEDAFEPTSEYESIKEQDEEEPVVDLETLINKKDDDTDDSALDNTIETDLFNLIDSMYKSEEDDKDESEE